MSDSASCERLRTSTKSSAAKKEPCSSPSVCGCAAGSMRPGVAKALENEKAPEVRTTVFAGQDLEATERAREYFTGYPPSSPSVALLKGGDLIYMMERHQIEGRTAEQIAADLREAFDQHL